MYHFIVNINSRTGKAKKIWEELKEELDRRKTEYELHITKYAGLAIDIARKTIVEKQILETFFEALKHFSEYEKLNDLQFKDELEQFLIQETVKFI